MGSLGVSGTAAGGYVTGQRGRGWQVRARRPAVLASGGSSLGKHIHGSSPHPCGMLPLTQGPRWLGGTGKVGKHFLLVHPQAVGL